MVLGKQFFGSARHGRQRRPLHARKGRRALRRLQRRARSARILNRLNVELLPLVTSPPSRHCGGVNQLERGERTQRLSSHSARRSSGLPAGGGSQTTGLSSCMEHMAIRASWRSRWGCGLRAANLQDLRLGDLSRIPRVDERSRRDRSARVASGGGSERESEPPPQGSRKATR